MNDMVTRNYTLLHTLKLTLLKDKSSMYTESNFFQLLIREMEKTKREKKELKRSGKGAKRSGKKIKEVKKEQKEWK